MSYATVQQSFVEDAIRRWQAKGLIDSSLARALSEENAATALVEQRREGEHTIDAVGAVVLFIGLVVFFVWAWPHLAETTRVFGLFGAGAALFAAGSLIAARTTMTPAGHALQAIGTVVLLGSYIYSEEAWQQATRPAQAVGLVSVITPFVLARLGLGRAPLTAAVAVAAGFTFLYTGLARATTSGPNPIIWTLDAALVALLAWLWFRTQRLRRVLDPVEIAVLTIGLVVGLLFTLLTAIGPLGMERWAVLPLDAWVLLVLALGFAGLRLDSPPVPHAWLSQIIGGTALLSIGLAFWTIALAAELPYQVTALLVGGLGALWIGVGLRISLGALVQVGALSVISAAWYFSMNAGGALTAAAALAVTAGVLFWVSGRMRGATRSPASPPSP